MPDVTDVDDGRRDRDDAGRFAADHDVGPADVLEAMDPLEPYTTGELAADLGVPRRTLYNYLEALHADGRVAKKKPEPRRAIWIWRQPAEVTDT